MYSKVGNFDNSVKEKIVSGQDSVKRAAGLLVIECKNSNANGDPDVGGGPRVRYDEISLISDVSVKRKLRNMILDRGEYYKVLVKSLGLDGDRFQILEDPSRDKPAIHELIHSKGVDAFHDRYWDARVFGNTFLEENKTAKSRGAASKIHIRTGPVVFAWGESIAPVIVDTQTCTNMSGVQEGKDCGMAPDRAQQVKHAIYAMPFYIDPFLADKTCCSAQDIEVLMRLIPHIYSSCRCTTRPEVQLLHAYYFETVSKFGGHEMDLVKSLRPVKKDVSNPSSSSDEYSFPGFDNPTFKKYANLVGTTMDLMDVDIES